MVSQSVSLLKRFQVTITVGQPSTSWERLLTVLLASWKCVEAWLALSQLFKLLLNLPVFAEHVWAFPYRKVDTLLCHRTLATSWSNLRSCAQKFKEKNQLLNWESATFLLAPSCRQDCSIVPGDLSRQDDLAHEAPIVQGTCGHQHLLSQSSALLIWTLPRRITMHEEIAASCDSTYG